MTSADSANWMFTGTGNTWLTHYRRSRCRDWRLLLSATTGLAQSNRTIWMIGIHSFEAVPLKKLGLLNKRGDPERMRIPDTASEAFNQSVHGIQMLRPFTQRLGHLRTDLRFARTLSRTSAESGPMQHHQQLATLCRVGHPICWDSFVLPTIARLHVGGKSATSHYRRSLTLSPAITRIQGHRHMSGHTTHCHTTIPKPPIQCKYRSRTTTVPCVPRAQSK